MSKESIKPFVQGIVAGAIVLLIVIFWAGWVVTTSSANEDATEMAETAVVDRLAAICVAQFQQDPTREEGLVELKETSSFQRDDYVEERGWATMPGDESPERKVADACQKQLMKLEQ
jgi:hypothetical protein